MQSDYRRDIFRELDEMRSYCTSLTKDIGNLKSKQTKDIANLKNEHKQDIITLKADHKIEIEKLNARLNTVEQENIILKNDNERLKRIINNDSSNSSKPPSSDIKGNNPNQFSSRTKTGKKAGGQKGRKGVNLTKQRIEDQIQLGVLEHQLVHVGTPTENYESRYVIDFEIKRIAKEYRFYAGADGKIRIPKEFNAPVTYGSTLKTIVVYLYSEGSMSIARIQDFINSVGEGISISSGCIYGILKQFRKKIEIYLEMIIEELLNSDVLYTDATTIRSEGRNAYIRNQSTRKVVLFIALTHKSLEKLRSCKVLAKFAGTLVHDHESALYHFGSDHGECNVHLERYLRKNTEETKNGWSFHLVQKRHLEKKEKVPQGKSFTKDEIKNYEKEYDDIVKLGRKENTKTTGITIPERTPDKVRRLCSID